MSAFEAAEWLSAAPGDFVAYSLKIHVAFATLARCAGTGNASSKSLFPQLSTICRNVSQFLPIPSASVKLEDAYDVQS